MTPTDVSAVLGADYSIANVVTAGTFMGTNELLFNGVMFSIAGMYVAFFLTFIRRYAKPRA